MSKSSFKKSGKRKSEPTMDAFIERACESPRIAILFWCYITKHMGLSAQEFEQGLRVIINQADCNNPNERHSLTAIKRLYYKPTSEHRASSFSGTSNTFESPLSYTIDQLKTVSFIKSLYTVLGQSLDVNLCNTDGNTALLTAILNNRYSTAAFLLTTCNANPNIANRNGRSPLLIAAETNWREVYGHEHEADTAYEGNLIDILLQNKADPNRQYPGCDNTPLLVAIRRGQLNNIQSLIMGGAKVNRYAPNRAFEMLHYQHIPRKKMKGFLPLNTAIETMQFEGARYILLNSNVKVNKQDSYHYTPLHYLVSFLYKHHNSITPDVFNLISEIMHLILMRGGNLDENIMDSKAIPEQIPSPSCYLEVISVEKPRCIRELYVCSAAAACRGAYELPWRHGIRSLSIGQRPAQLKPNNGIGESLLVGRKEITFKIDWVAEYESHAHAFHTHMHDADAPMLGEGGAAASTALESESGEESDDF